MSDYFTDTFDKQHLLMCEKEDLVGYIECLRLDVKKLKEQNEKLKEFINQQKVTVVKLDEHGQELSK